ncbi:MAG: hypothetical protein WAW75_05000, partial [Gallionella sp.]
RVIADPGMAAAMMDMHKAHDETMKAVTAALGKLSAMPEQHHEESKVVAYDIEHETDRHSPRFGRITRVVPQVETQ